MAISLANGKQTGSGVFQRHEGMVFKRQRGRSLRKESGRMRLKFQPRFCILNNTGFVYKLKKGDKPKDVFPIGRIKFVKDMAPDTFSEYSLSGINDQHCFQFGDEMEVLYLIAPTEKEKKVWMSMLEQAAKINGNEMLKTYHQGAYGSKKPEEWSCCGYSGQNQEGCYSVSDNSRVHPRQPTHKSSHTDELSNTVPRAQPVYSPKKLEFSYRKSYSADNTSSIQPPEHGHLQTSQSFDGTTRPIFCLKEDDHDTSYVCLVRSYDQETVPLTAASTIISRQTMTTDIEEPLTYDTIVSKEVYLSVDGSNSELNETKNTTQLIGMNLAASHDQHRRKQKSNQETPEFEAPLNSAFSYHLVESLTALKSHQHQLISGNTMLHVWGKTPDLTLTSSLKVAGEVYSLDTWKDFIAVGSAVVQVIKLNPTGDPRRILYINGRNNLPHSESSSSRLLVSFVGDSGVLASAVVGGITIDIWDSPTTELRNCEVMKPKTNIKLQNENIVSLTTSKNPTESWIVVITKANGHIEATVLDWKSSTPHHNFKISDDHEISNIFVHLSRMYLVVGYGGYIEKLEAQTGRILHSRTLDQTISCLSGSKGGILIGTTDGDVITYSEDDLAQIHRFTNSKSEASVVAVAAEEDFSSLYIAYSDGGLKVWSEQVDDIHENIQGLASICNDDNQALDCVLGQQLCSEGILTQRQTFNLSNQKSLSFQFKDNGASIELPPEILDCPNAVFEAAFSPFGPIGSQFILPDKMIPVSSAMWLCVSPYKEFQSPAMLKLSHCFTCKSANDAKLLHFLKAEHKDISRDKFGNLTIKFEEVDPAQSEFPPNKQSGILKDHHFCIYCLTAVSQEEEVVSKINYCLTILKPKLYPTKEHMRIYCILHLDLEGCKRLIAEKQAPKDYETVTKYLQFTTGRFESALEIQLNKVEAERCGWMITMESEKKIYVEDVNFFNYRKVDYLEDACYTSDIHKPYPYAYPPRFVLEVSARYAEHHSTIELTFIGARRNLYTEIQLHPLRGEDDLNPQLDGTSLGDGDAQRPTGESVPLPFPNGTCEQENNIIDSD